MKRTDPKDHPLASDPMPLLHLDHIHTHAHAQTPLPTTAGTDIHLQSTPTTFPTNGIAIATQATEAKEEVASSHFFKGAQQHGVVPLVLFAWGTTNTSTPSAQPPSCGMEEKHGCDEMTVGSLSPWMASPFVSVSRPQQGAQIPHTPQGTHAWAAENLAMEPSSVLLHRKSNPLTPYHPEEWLRQLSSFSLLEKYPSLYHSLICSFDVGIPSILQTYIPLNNPSIYKYPEAYSEIVEKELRKGRYIGPFSQAKLKTLIGPFQSSPLSLVPKPGKPGKFHAVHDFSHPHPLGKNLIPSINSAINSHDFPCTWGTFSTVCLIIYLLPPGSQASIWDVSEAYHTIPVHHQQWPGLVVCLREEDSFAANISNNFRLTSAGGAHGLLADAGSDIIRVNGIGPLSKWVDDHIFFRIPHHHLPAYNAQHHSWHQAVMDNGGQIHEGSRLWFRGVTMEDGQPEEFDEDIVFPLHDLSCHSPHSSEDAKFTYANTDINRISDELRIPWEPSKTVPFSNVVPYLGFVWNLTTRTVEILLEKKHKYLEVIKEWQKKPWHTLAEVQKLYGKLLHTTLVVPAGRVYLTSMEAMLSLFNNHPFVPHSSPHDMPHDLEWWSTLLESQTLSRPIPGPTPLEDTHAFSDASSGFGIGITIGGRWHAWCLLPNWKLDG